MKSNITFKRVYEYGGDCKADDTDYICGYRASNGVMIERKYADGLNVYCWKVGENYYDTLNAAKNAVIRKASEAETPETPQETASEPEAAQEQTEEAKARDLHARARELRERAEGLCEEGKLHENFVRSVQKVELQAYKAAAHESAVRLASKNPRVAAAMERLRAKQTVNGEPEVSATDAEQEKKLTLLDVHTTNLSAIETEEIFAVRVYYGVDCSHMDFADVAEAMNEFGRDTEVFATDIDCGATLHIWLMLSVDECKDVVRSFGERLNAVERTGDVVRATNARIALWERIDEFKRRGVALEAEYNADGYFVDVREWKPEAAADVNGAAEVTANPTPEFDYDFLSGRYAIFSHADGVFSNEYETDDLKEAREYLKEEVEGTVKHGDYAIFDRDARQYIQIRATPKGRKAFKAENGRLAAKAAAPASQTEPEAAAGQPAPQEAATSEGDMGEIMTAAKSRKAKPPKQYTIRVTRDRTGRAHDHTGTLEELIQAFSYTLEKGKSWEWERGRRKINLAPKTARSLVNNLQNASDNATVNGYSGVTYELVTV